jgi:hypothetical protein
MCKNVPSYFDSAALSEIPSTFGERPSEKDFIEAVAQHAGVPSYYVDVKLPRDEKSKALYLAFLANAKNVPMFYVCYPSSTDKGKCWAIGCQVNDRDASMMAQFDAMDVNLAEVRKLREAKATSSPFAALEKLKEVLPAPLTPLQRFEQKCPEYSRFKNMGRVKSAEVLFTSTGGRPCLRCSRPADCARPVITAG